MLFFSCYIALFFVLQKTLLIAKRKYILQYFTGELPTGARNCERIFRHTVIQNTMVTHIVTYCIEFPLFQNLMSSR